MASYHTHNKLYFMSSVKRVAWFGELLLKTFTLFIYRDEPKV